MIQTSDIFSLCMPVVSPKCQQLLDLNDRVNVFVQKKRMESINSIERRTDIDRNGLVVLTASIEFEVAKCMTGDKISGGGQVTPNISSETAARLMTW